MQEIAPLSVEIILRRKKRGGGPRSISSPQATRSLVICFIINMVACSHFSGPLIPPGACVLCGHLSPQATGRLWFVSVACYVNIYGRLQNHQIFASYILGGGKFYHVLPLWSPSMMRSLYGSSLHWPTLMMLPVPETRQPMSHLGEKGFKCVVLPNR